MKTIRREVPDDQASTPEQAAGSQAPALVISLVALFAALSGAALALPGTQTVNSGDIKDEAVKSIDLKDNAAVTSDDVVDESLTGTDVTDETIASNDVQNDDRCRSGPTSPTRRSPAADVAGDTLQANDLAPNSVQSEEIGDGIHNHYEHGRGCRAARARTRTTTSSSVTAELRRGRGVDQRRRATGSATRTARS